MAEEKNCVTVTIKADTTELDEAIEKANHLAELLKEVQKVADSLFGGKTKEETK